MLEWRVHVHYAYTYLQLLSHSELPDHVTKAVTEPKMTRQPTTPIKAIVLPVTVVLLVAAGLAISTTILV